MFSQVGLHRRILTFIAALAVLIVTINLLLLTTGVSPLRAVLPAQWTAKVHTHMCTN